MCSSLSGGDVSERSQSPTPSNFSLGKRAVASLCVDWRSSWGLVQSASRALESAYTSIQVFAPIVWPPLK